jgi:hypothetical protein
MKLIEIRIDPILNKYIKIIFNKKYLIGNYFMVILENFSIYLYKINMNSQFSISDYSIKHILNILIDLSFYLFFKNRL